MWFLLKNLKLYIQYFLMSDLFKFKMSKTTKRLNFEMLGFIKEEKKDFRILNLK